MADERASKSVPGVPVEPGTLLEQVRAQGERLVLPGLELRLAHAYGFCQGVRRAVSRALRAASDSPRGDPGDTAARPRRLFITGEIIHNPAINEQLGEAGAVRLPPYGTPGRLAGIGPEDRVIVPAFGIDIAEERQLRAIGCEVIDTTCGWVRKVWLAAGEFSRAGLTLVIHGKAEHEETRATASRIRGPWIVVRTIAEATALAAAVRDPSAAALGALPAPDGLHASRSFDPQRDLARLGLVNQTTMLASETRTISRLLRQALADRLGAPPGSRHYQALETFCTATQKRQDAVRELLAPGDLQLLIVVGGFRSSNTAHLARLGAEQVPTFHVEDAACLLDAGRIRHRPAGASQPLITRDWLPPAPRRIGLTAGASTPEREIGRLLGRLVALHREAAAESPASGAEGGAR